MMAMTSVAVVMARRHVVVTPPTVMAVAVAVVAISIAVMVTLSVTFLSAGRAARAFGRGDRRGAADFLGQVARVHLPTAGDDDGSA
jgi:hypothetical protein